MSSISFTEISGGSCQVCCRVPCLCPPPPGFDTTAIVRVGSLRHALRALRLARELLGLQGRRIERLNAQVEELERKRERQEEQERRRQEREQRRAAHAVAVEEAVARVTAAADEEPRTPPGTPPGTRHLEQKIASLKNRLVVARKHIKALQDGSHAEKIAVRQQRGRDIHARFEDVARERLAPELYAELITEAKRRAAEAGEAS